MQLIAVLRFLGMSQDNVASALRVGKTTVVGTESWIREQPLEIVRGMFDDQALNRVVVRDLPDCEEVEEKTLVRAGMVTGDDILRHYRDDWPPVAPDAKPPVPQLEEHDLFAVERMREHKDDIHSVVGRWLRELAAPSPVTLLNNPERIVSDAVRDLTEDESARELYEQATMQHIRNIDPSQAKLIPLEQDPVYHKLRCQFSESPAWPAYDGWQSRSNDYLNALFQWQRALLKVGKYLEGQLGRDTWATAKTKLSCLFLGCDLLAKGILEFETDIRWPPILDDARRLRGFASALILTLAPGLQADDVSAFTSNICNDAEDSLGVVGSTRSMLVALSRLWRAQDQLETCLRELESSVLE